MAALTVRCSAKALRAAAGRAARRSAPSQAPLLAKCLSAAAAPLPAAGLRPRTLHGGLTRGCERVRRFSAAGGIIEQAVNDFGGESITEGTVMEYRKRVGDFVSKGDVIAVIETDKVTIEVNAAESGTIRETLIEVDGTIQKGQVLVKIEAGAGAGAPALAAAASAPAAAAASRTGKILEQAVTDFGAESITEGTLMEWRKSVGDFVAKGELLAVVETDKVSLEVKAEEAGTVKEVLVSTDGTVEVGKPLIRIEVGAAPAGGAPAAAPSAAPSPAPAPAAAAAAPAAELTGLRAAFARLAAQRLGLPMPGAPVAPAATAAATPPATSRAQAVEVGEGRTETRIPISAARRRVTQRLKDSQNTAALLTTFQEADMTATREMCKKYKDSFQKNHGAQLGYLSVFAKASANACLEIPGINAVIDDSAKEIVYRDYVDISIPIPSPRGPVSCVLRGVESKSILDIEREIAGLMDKAAKDDLLVEDMVGATFGITDTGVAGGMMGTAVINPPQSAIMGTNAVTNRATVVDGKVVARPMMYLALTYDHRLIDGREAVTFLCSVRDKMEDPTRMLLEL